MEAISGIFWIGVFVGVVYLYVKFRLWLSRTATQKIFYRSEYQDSKKLLEPVVFDASASVDDIIQQLDDHVTLVELPLEYKAGLYQVSVSKKGVEYAFGNKLRPRSFEADISFITHGSKTQCIFNITKWHHTNGVVTGLDAMSKFHKQVLAAFEAAGGSLEADKQTEVTSDDIKCQSCGTDNLTSSAFCIECGNKLGGVNHQAASSSKSKVHNQGANQKVHQLKNMALMLDKACKDGVVIDEEVEKAQNVLNSINEKYQDDNDILGPNGYLIYEVQGLIHWVKGEEKDAKDLIRSAKNTKGDPQLFTDSANELRNSLLW